MPIFLNWFSVDCESLAPSLFYKDFSDWDESRDWHAKSEIPGNRYARFPKRADEGNSFPRSVFLDEFDGQPDSQRFKLGENRSVAFLLIRNAFAEHFSERGILPRWKRFQVCEFTRTQFEIAEFGLDIQTGIQVTPHLLRYLPDSEPQYGVTLNWTVRQFLRKPISEYSEPKMAIGFPVRFGAWNSHIDPYFEDKVDQYVGTVIEINETEATIVCRDRTNRKLPLSLIFPEPKPDVLSKMDEVLLKNGKPSAQNKVRQLTFALNDKGRRNLALYKDQLKSSIEFLNPGERPFLTLDLPSPLKGTMRVSLAPATARID